MATHEFEKIITIGALASFKDEADDLYATKEEVQDILDIGGEPNVIETVKVNGAALTPDANKAVNVTVTESTNNGKLSVNGTDVTIHGLGSAAYEATTAFDASGAAAAVLGTSSDGTTAKTVYGAIALANTKTANTATTTTPKMDGTAAVGSETAYAKGDHIHPTDTSRAPLASPALTGTPTAPTATAGTNTTQIATTAFVATAVANAISGASAFQGSVTSNTTIQNSSYKAGWYWLVTAAGTYVGQTCEVGDMVYAIANKGGSYSASDFAVVQKNVDMSLYTLKSDLSWATDAEVIALFE